MKYTAILFLLLLLPALSMAQQGRKDYREAVQKFMQAYNSGDGAGMSALFSDRSHDKYNFTTGKLAALKGQYRDMLSFNYITQHEDGLVIFRVKYAKYRGKYPDQYPDNIGFIGLTLDQNNKIYRMKMPTYAYPQDKPRYFFK